MPTNPIQTLIEKVAALEADAATKAAQIAALQTQVQAHETQLGVIALQIQALQADHEQLRAERVRWAPPYRFPQPPIT